MNPSMSIYLEAARFVATMIVLLGHGKIFYRPLADFCDLTNPGRDAVIIFFVLSGFVISWCGTARDRTVAQFAVNRAARVYSVAVPAVMLSLLASAVISHATGQPLDYQLRKLWLYLPIYLSFVGSLWTLNEVPPNNFPYWSLNFEVWYYVLFAAALYARGRWRWLLVALVLLVMGPGIIALLPLWLAGSLLYFQQHRITLSRMASRLLVYGSLAGYVLVKILGVDNWLDAWAGAWYAGQTGRKPAEPLLGDYLLGLLVFLNFVGALHAQFEFGAWLERLVKAAAACSFSIYLYHMPIFEMVHVFWPRDDVFWGYALIMLGCFGLIVLLARFTEQRKAVYRKYFSLLFRLPVRQVAH